MRTDDSYRSIGRVTSMTADAFTIELHHRLNHFTTVGFDDIHYLAQIGSFVMIPLLSDYIVTEIVELSEKDPTNRSPIQEENTHKFTKTTSTKYLKVVPLGTLPKDINKEFCSGISAFPSLYTEALYILDKELDRIFNVKDEKDGQQEEAKKYITIGTSTVFEKYDIKIRLDDYFGGHSAILGNTGSGKSCTMAAVLQSLFEKEPQNATFIIFDVHGEYKQAFQNLNFSHWQMTTKNEPHIFKIPPYLMSIEEWELLLRASERSQQPILRTALGLAHLFVNQNDENLKKIKNYILALRINSILDDSSSSPTKADHILAILSSFHTEELNPKTVDTNIEYGQIEKVEKITNLVKKTIEKYQQELPLYSCKDFFKFDHLENAFKWALLYEEAHGNKQIKDYCAQMITRLKKIKEREDFHFLRRSEESQTADAFIKELLGFQPHANQDDKLSKKIQIIILDLQEASDEALGLISAVLARLIFEWIRKEDTKKRSPIHFILDEAHRYIPEKPPQYAIDMRSVFERLAKEGRKYGIFLQVISQRPSELSKTVLSQCSNFIIHKIQNPDDLHYIRQMTPYISESITKRLPSLPQRHALVFGNAINLPVTVKMREADPPTASDDVKVSQTWFSTQEKAKQSN